ncbi:MAG: ornithine carbamoyltransferase [Hyphomicrobiales bacterium]|nr:ornithine carbamoyltransferase [Hyphomicrobiales bacterium]
MTDAPRHFLDLSDFTDDQLYSIIDHAGQMKSAGRPGADAKKPLAGKILAMIFDKPSTRTRVSFDVGMRHLGGETIILSSADSQMGRGESIADTARVLSRYVDAIMIRTTTHDRLLEMAHYASVPVINALTDDTHPCQLMADVMTFEEHSGPIKNKKIAWTGDGNNVLNSFVHASAKFEFDLAVATPPGRQLDERFLDWGRQNGARIKLYDNAEMAVSNSDCVVTDTWVSMGEEDRAEGHNTFMPYQVNANLMSKANSDAVFMHCLPAHRGEEVTDEVMDGPQSIVFDEAENRLHVQKAILAWCLAPKG